VIAEDEEACAAPTITPAEHKILWRLLAGAGAESGAGATAAGALRALLLLPEWLLSPNPTYSTEDSDEWTAAGASCSSRMSYRQRIGRERERKGQDSFWKRKRNERIIQLTDRPDRLEIRYLSLRPAAPASEQPIMEQGLGQPRR
jgi:hypothetical protein